MRIYFFCLLIFSCLGSRLMAQNLCSKTLKQAQENYDRGIISSIPDELADCLEKGFTKAEKIQAYRLIILSYLFEDNLEAADSTLYILYQTDPEYQYNPDVDPGEYIAFMDKYKCQPILSFGVHGGMTYAQPNLVENFGVENTSENNGKYDGRIGYTFGIGTDIRLKDRISISTGLDFSNYYYLYDHIQYGYSHLAVEENQMALQVPVTVKFNILNNKFRPYVKLGASFSYLIFSELELSKENTEDGSDEATGPSVDVMNQRNKLNFYGLGGVGAAYKLGYGYIFLDLKYYYAFDEVTDPEERFSNEELIYKYHYIDDSFYLNAFMISIGYYKSIYKTKKLVNYE